MSLPAFLAVLTALLVACDDGLPSLRTGSQPWLDPSSDVKLTADQVREHYLKADPAADVESASAKGDRRFICVMGYAASYPGVDDPKLVERYGSWTFPYVTDVVDDELLHRRAHEYASAYNALLVHRLKADTP